MTATQQIDAEAQRVAAELGRDWIDCGAYERQSLRDEAARRLCGSRERIARIIHDSWSVEPFDAVRHAEDWAAADAVLAAFPQLQQ